MPSAGVQFGVTTMAAASGIRELTSHAAFDCDVSDCQMKALLGAYWAIPDKMTSDNLVCVSVHCLGTRYYGY